MFKVLSSMEYPEFLRVRCKVKGFGLDCVYGLTTYGLYRGSKGCFAL